MQRFGLKQIFLLIALCGLFAGAYATLQSQQPGIYYYSAAASADGRWLVVVGSQGWDLYDLVRKRRAVSKRWHGIHHAYPGKIRERVAFVDDDRFSYVDSDDAGVTSPYTCIRYSISERTSEPIAVFASPDVDHAVRFTDRGIVARTDLVESPHVAKTNSDDSLTFIGYDGTTRKLDVKVSVTHQFRASLDLRWVVVFDDPRYGLGHSPRLTVYDLKTHKSVDLLTVKIRDAVFSPDGRHLFVCTDREMRVFEWSAAGARAPTGGPAGVDADADAIGRRFEEDETRRGAVEREGVTQPEGGSWREKWSIGLLDTPDFLAIDDESRVVVFGDRWGYDNAVRIVDLPTGRGKSRFEGYQGTCDVAFIPGTTTVAVIPSSSENAVQIRDWTNGRVVERLGGQNRTGAAFIYTFFFLGWSVVWGLWGSSRTLDQPQNTSEAAPFETVVVADLVAPPQRRVFFQGDARTPPGMRTVWIQMTVGGAFAIVWAVMPMFFIDSGFLATAFPWVAVVRMAMAWTCLVVGLAAMSAGVGRARRGLKWIAILQMVNGINMDVVNLGLGIAELVLLVQMPRSGLAGAPVNASPDRDDRSDR